MSFETYAYNLEKFLNEEFKNKVPLLVLKDKSLLYKRFRIKQAKNLSWQLRFVDGDCIEHFQLKASATIAAKCYDTGDFVKLSEIKVLDTQYWQNAMDSYIFKSKIKTVKDPDKFDIFVARLELASSREEYYKKKITSMFRTTFDK